MEKMTVTGTVSKVFYDNKAAEVTVYFPKKNGDTGEKKYKAWFESAQPFVVGEAITVTGQYSDAIEDWVDKDKNPKMDNTGRQGRSIVRNLNNASYVSDSPDFNAAVTAATPAAGEDAPF